MKNDIHKIYNAACERYWSTNDFYIDIGTSQDLDADKAILKALESKLNSGAIQRLRLVGIKCVYTMTTEPGIWRATSHLSTLGRPYRLCAVIFRQRRLDIHKPQRSQTVLGVEWPGVEWPMSSALRRMSSIDKSMLCTRYEEIMRLLVVLLGKRELFRRMHESPI